MQPISFACSKLIPMHATEICAEVADVARWHEFSGYGVLPGIASAEYEHRTADMIGSRVRVRNTDGSGHVEEFYLWDPGRKIAMRFTDFTPPLQQLATHFTEEWVFDARGDSTLVTRKFNLFPKHALARPGIWLISLLFRRAIAHHLVEMSKKSGATKLES